MVDATVKGPEQLPGIFGYVDDFLFDGLHILVGEDGTVMAEDGSPYLQIASGKFWVNNHAHVLTGAKVPTDALWFALRSVAVDSAVTGAVQPKLSMGRLSALEITYPLQPEPFEETASACIQHVIRCRSGMETLGQLRAFLLPLLLDGSLRVQPAQGAEGEIS